MLLECRPVDPIGRLNQVPSPGLRDHVLEPRSAAWIGRLRERSMFAGDSAAMAVGSILVRNGMEMDSSDDSESERVESGGPSWSPKKGGERVVWRKKRYGYRVKRLAQILSTTEKNLES